MKSFVNDTTLHEIYKEQSVQGHYVLLLPYERVPFQHP